MNDEVDPFKGLEDDDVEEVAVQALGADLSILKERFANQIDADISLTNTSISTSDNSDNEESDNVEGEPIIKPGIEEVQKAIGILEDFSLYSKFGESMMR